MDERCETEEARERRREREAGATPAERRAEKQRVVIAVGEECHGGIVRVAALASELRGLAEGYRRIAMNTVAALAAALAAGKTTSRELLEQALARIADPAGEGARVFTKVYTETARAEADHSDRLRRAGIVRSPIDGLPVSVKDLFDVGGDVTRAGSKILSAAAPAQRDAGAVARLRAAGAVIIGRTNMVEFAFGVVGANPHYGTPTNPFERARGRVPGGSSSGAAVAVADDMCAMSLGSDTRGSVRVPAALCGVTGFKPTARRVPRDGAFPLSYTLDSVGPIAKSVASCAAFDAVLAAEAQPTLTMLTARGLRLLLPRSSVLDDLQPAVAAAFAAALATLRAAGALVVDVPMPAFRSSSRSPSRRRIRRSGGVFDSSEPAGEPASTSTTRASANASRWE